MVLFLYFHRLNYFGYFIFYFIPPSLHPFLQKFPVNLKIKKLWPYPYPSYPTLPCPALPYPTLPPLFPTPDLPCPALPYPHQYPSTLPYLTPTLLPYPAPTPPLSYPTVPNPTLPYPTPPLPLPYPLRIQHINITKPVAVELRCHATALITCEYLREKRTIRYICLQGKRQTSLLS